MKFKLNSTIFITLIKLASFSVFSAENFDLNLGLQETKAKSEEEMIAFAKQVAQSAVAINDTSSSSNLQELTTITLHNEESKVDQQKINEIPKKKREKNISQVKNSTIVISNLNKLTKIKGESEEDKKKIEEIKKIIIPPLTQGMVFFGKKKGGKDINHYLEIMKVQNKPFYKDIIELIEASKKIREISKSILPKISVSKTTRQKDTLKTKNSRIIISNLKEIIIILDNKSEKSKKLIESKIDEITKALSQGMVFFGRKGDNPGDKNIDHYLMIIKAKDESIFDRINVLIENSKKLKAQKFRASEISDTIKPKRKRKPASTKNTVQDQTTLQNNVERTVTRAVSRTLKNSTTMLSEPIAQINTLLNQIDSTNINTEQSSVNSESNISEEIKQQKELSESNLPIIALENFSSPNYIVSNSQSSQIDISPEQLENVSATTIGSANNLNKRKTNEDIPNDSSKRSRLENLESSSIVAPTSQSSNSDNSNLLSSIHENPIYDTSPEVLKNLDTVIQGLLQEQNIRTENSTTLTNPQTIPDEELQRSDEIPNTQVFPTFQDQQQNKENQELKRTTESLISDDTSINLDKVVAELLQAQINDTNTNNLISQNEESDKAEKIDSLEMVKKSKKKLKILEIKNTKTVISNLREIINLLSNGTEEGKKLIENKIDVINRTSSEGILTFTNDKKKIGDRSINYYLMIIKTRDESIFNRINKLIENSKKLKAQRNKPETKISDTVTKKKRKSSNQMVLAHDQPSVQSNVQRPVTRAISRAALENTTRILAEPIAQINTSLNQTASSTEQPYEIITLLDEESKRSGQTNQEDEKAEFDSSKKRKIEAAAVSVNEDSREIIDVRTPQAIVEPEISASELPSDQDYIQENNLIAKRKEKFDLVKLKIGNSEELLSIMRNLPRVNNKTKQARNIYQKALNDAKTLLEKGVYLATKDKFGIKEFTAMQYAQEGQHKEFIELFKKYKAIYKSKVTQTKEVEIKTTQEIANISEDLSSSIVEPVQVSSTSNSPQVRQDETKAQSEELKTINERSNSTGSQADSQPSSNGVDPAILVAQHLLNEFNNELQNNSQEQKISSENDRDQSRVNNLQAKMKKENVIEILDDEEIQENRQDSRIKKFQNRRITKKLKRSNTNQVLKIIRELTCDKESKKYKQDLQEIDVLLDKGVYYGLKGANNQTIEQCAQEHPKILELIEKYYTRDLLQKYEATPGQAKNKQRLVSLLRILRYLNEYQYAKSLECIEYSLKIKTPINYKDYSGQDRLTAYEYVKELMELDREKYIKLAKIFKQYHPSLNLEVSPTNISSQPLSNSSAIIPVSHSSGTPEVAQEKTEAENEELKTVRESDQNNISRETTAVATSATPAPNSQNLNLLDLQRQSQNRDKIVEDCNSENISVIDRCLRYLSVPLAPETAPISEYLTVKLSNSFTACARANEIKLIFKNNNNNEEIPFGTHTGKILNMGIVEGCRNQVGNPSFLFSYSLGELKIWDIVSKTSQIIRTKNFLAPVAIKIALDDASGKINMNGINKDTNMQESQEILMGHVVIKDGPAIKIFDMETQKCIKQFSKHSSDILQMSSTKDKNLVTYSKGEIRIWDITVSLIEGRRIVISSKGFSNYAKTKNFLKINVMNINDNGSVEIHGISEENGPNDKQILKNADFESDDSPSSSFPRISSNAPVTRILKADLNNNIVAYVDRAVDANVIKIANDATKKILRTLKGHTNIIQALEKVQKGIFEDYDLISYSVGELRLWNTSTGQVKIAKTNNFVKDITISGSFNGIHLGGIIQQPDGSFEENIIPYELDDFTVDTTNIGNSSSSSSTISDRTRALIAANAANNLQSIIDNALAGRSPTIR